ncbi:MAG: hypothetical protein M1816_001019 [Peltula sp. TS41687]|nr:MAG: hypothetical protein M1816_001019 [Peltula sp. TS41687]
MAIKYFTVDAFRLLVEGSSAKRKWGKELESDDPEISSIVAEPPTEAGNAAKRFCKGETKDVKEGIKEERDTQTQQPSRHTKTSPNGRPAATGPHPSLEEANPQPGKDEESSLVRHWVLEGDYPKGAFKNGVNMSTMQPPLTKKRSSSSIRTKSDTSDTSSAYPQVKSRLYEGMLVAARIYLDLYKASPTDPCKKLCRELLEAEQLIPKDTLFQDDLFQLTCDRVQGENEAMITADITPLVVPRAEILYAYGAKHLQYLVGRLNTEWHNAIPLVTNTSPKPDYSVGFKPAAFTKDQLRKMKAFIGISSKNHLMAMYDMYFPFLTCEVKCGNEALNVADRQNAHNSSFAVNAIITLYNAVGRKMELHRKILAFSLSHDHDNIRIYGHYALLDQVDGTAFHRYLIRRFSILDQEGKDRWAAYRFTRNVYDKFMPIQLKRIQEALDQLPDYSFENGDASTQTVDEASPTLPPAAEQPAAKRTRT